MHERLWNRLQNFLNIFSQAFMKETLKINLYNKTTKYQILNLKLFGYFVKYILDLIDE